MEFSSEMAGIESLPELCLERVLSFLHAKQDRVAASLTCRDWRFLLSSLCRAVCIKHDPVRWETLPLDVVEALSAFPQATSLTIQGQWCWRAISSQVFSPSPQLARLTTLNLTEITIENSQEWASSLTLACPALTHLHLHQHEFTDSELATLGRGCPRLTSFSNVGGITDTGIEALLSNAPALAEFCVDHNHRSKSVLEGWGFRAASTSLSSITIASCDTLTCDGLAEGLRFVGSTLRSLILRSNWVRNAEKHAPGEVDLVALIAQHCNRLEELHLYDVYQVCRPVSLQLVRWKTLPALRSLHVKGCQITSLSEEQGWEALATASPMLEDLYVRQFDLPFEDLLVRILDRSWPLLRTLNLFDDYPVYIRSSKKK